MANYNATYEADDTSLVVIDLIVTVIVGFVSFGTLISLIMLYRWFKKQGVRLG